MPHPEIDLPNFLPPLEEVAAAYEAVAGHNDDYTGYGVTHRANEEVRNDLGLEQGERLDTVPGIEQYVKDKASRIRDAAVVGAEIQTMLHGDTLTRIGVDVKVTDDNALGFDIANSEIFSEWLHGLEADNPRLEQVKPLLLGLMGYLADKVEFCFTQDVDVVDEYTIAEFNEYGMDLLRTFALLEPEYARLGIDGPSYSEKYLRAVETYDGAKVEMDLRGQIDEDAAEPLYVDKYRFLQKCLAAWGDNHLVSFVNDHPLHPVNSR